MKLNRVLKILILLLILSAGYGYASTSFYSYDDPEDILLVSEGVISIEESYEILHTFEQEFSSIDSISLEVHLYDDNSDVAWDMGLFLVSINGTIVDMEIGDVEGSKSDPDILYYNNLDELFLSETETGPITIELLLTINPLLLSDFYYASSTLTVVGAANSNALDDDSQNPMHAPIPSGILLFASSVIGLLGFRKR